MKLTDKTKLLGYFNKTELSALDYESMTRTLTSKYPKSAFINYFTLLIFENLNKDKFSLKLMKKLVASTTIIISLCLKNNEPLTGEIKERIASINELYQTLVSNKSPLIDDELTQMFTELIAESSKIATEDIKREENDLIKVKSDLDIVIKRQAEEIAKLKSTIANLTSTNKEKRDKIRELENSLENALKELKNLQDELATLKTNSLELATNNSNLTKENIRLDKRVQSLRREVSSKTELSEDSFMALKQEFKRIRSELEARIETLRGELIVERKRGEDLEAEKETYRAKYKDAFAEMEHKNKKKNRNAKIERIILEMLFTSECSLKNIIESLKARNYDLTAKELTEYIMRLRRKINIEVVGFDLQNPVFKIMPPLIKTGGSYNFTLPDNDKPLKVFIEADAHIRSFSESFIENYKRMLDYCDKNSVDLIIGLGDFFDLAFGNNLEFSYDHLSELTDLVLEYADKIPKSPIMHTLIGGNHEKDTLPLGKDLLKFFADRRSSDFMFLGYDYAELIFKRRERDILKLLAAHPCETVKNDHQSVFGQIFHNYDFTFLGHSHRNKIFLSQNVCQVTTFGKQNRERGALAADIYFDETGLTSIDLKPLILKRELKPATIIHIESPKKSR